MYPTLTMSWFLAKVDCTVTCAAFKEAGKQKKSKGKRGDEKFDF